MNRYQKIITYTNNRFDQLAAKNVAVFHSRGKGELGIWSFTLPKKHPNDVADAFAVAGICVRSGHHCCEPLHTHLGVQGTVRVSIGYQTTLSEMEQFFAVLESFL